MQEYIRKRVLEVCHYMLDTTATVRQTAAVFGVSKSTIQTVLIIGVGYIGYSNMRLKS